MIIGEISSLPTCDGQVATAEPSTSNRLQSDALRGARCIPHVHIEARTDVCDGGRQYCCARTLVRARKVLATATTPSVTTSAGCQSSWSRAAAVRGDELVRPTPPAFLLSAESPSAGRFVGRISPATISRVLKQYSEYGCVPRAGSLDTVVVGAPARQFSATGRGVATLVDTPSSKKTRVFQKKSANFPTTSRGRLHSLKIVAQSMARPSTTHKTCRASAQGASSTDEGARSVLRPYETRWYGDVPVRAKERPR